MRAILIMLSTHAIALGLLLVPSAAYAAVPVPPTGLSPTDGTTVNHIPTLTWDRVTDADKYEVQIALTAEYANPIWTKDTANLSATPNLQVPTGDVWWRVRSVNSTGRGAWATASFVRDPVAPPTLTGPTEGDVLGQPSEVPTFTWVAVPGATSYTVEISSDANFTDPTLIKTYTSKSTSLVLADLQLPTTYFWRVRGLLAPGFATAFSQPRSYTVQGLSPALLVGPEDDATVNVTEVLLDWASVPGAATYDLQVGTDSNFLTKIVDVTGIVGTRYSRPDTLDNDQYYWRVRPVDGSGNKLDWSQATTWQFRRNWPDQPRLEYPVDGSTVGDPFYFQWGPVPWASSYDVQISTSPGFGTYESCPTVHTTLAPGGDCQPAPEETYYWRVMAHDEFRVLSRGDRPNTDIISAEVSRFTYLPERVTLVSPAAGATVSVPTLTWEPTNLAKTYKVTLTNATTGSTTTATTTGTSFTPRTVLSVGATYRWQVQPVYEDGRTGVSLSLPGQPTFTVAAQATGSAATPEPTGPDFTSHQSFPTLTWQAVSLATHYRLMVRRAGSSLFTRLGAQFVYPAGEDTSATYLDPGTYEWYAEAYRSGSSVPVEATTLSTFTVVPVDKVSGYTAALTGTATFGAAGHPQDTCRATLPFECQNLRQTPVLSWDPVQGASRYQVIISRDSELTNVVGTYPSSTNMLMLTETLPDSQAGSAYFWLVRACRDATTCSPLIHAAHSFNKMSVAVHLTSPADAETVQDDVTLDWERQLDAQTDPAALEDTSLGLTPARTEALTYVVATATDPNFQNVLEQVTVDQTSFTSFAQTYPEGPIYWRVRANDGSGNPMAWSATRSFVKASPVATPLSPSSGALVRGEQPFSWFPLDYAASYDVQVFKDDDRVGNDANLVLSKSTKQVVLASGDPIPPSAAPYTWRIRRTDAKGRKGAWTALRPFTVTGDAPTLTSPAPDALVSPTAGVFTWAAQQTATSYRWQRRLAGADAVSESVVTPATSWAPLVAIGAGSWQWQVVALDANGKSLGASPWRPFTVIDPPIATTDVSVTGSGAIGTSLTLSEPAWNVGGVATTYQWYRGSSVIPDQTQATYELTPADLDKAITVRATGALPGYRPGTSTSNVIVGGRGAAVQPTVAPTITGTPAAGQTLTANPGTWPGSATYRYQWLRNGVAIDRADDPTYVVQAADAGRSLRVTVTATVPGYEPGIATSAPVTVRKLTTRTVAALAAKRIRAAQRATMSVRVTSVYLSNPVGPVRVYVGRKVMLTVQLRESHGGAISARLPKLKKGIYKVKAVYAGSAATSASTSRVLTLTVTR
ncbi:MAG: Ig-like domain repeat protein [Nocardioides sp.]|nr:Ig-like domain repeat protein [Nocardioides sp.]